jgi:plastocyanin
VKELIALVVLAFAFTACSPSRYGTSPSVDPAAADETVIASDMKFDQESITIRGGSAWRLQLVNEDAAPHNVAIYADESAGKSLFVGELISSATVVYQVPALEPGTYFFRCDLHPEMSGTLVVEG